MSFIFLSRDGVINEISNGAVLTPESWRPVPGSIRAIARLTHAHYRVVVTSSQPALATGDLDVGTLNRIHEKMHREVASEGGKIEAIIYCPHAPRDQCDCHKPNSGMFFEISQRLHIDLTGVPIISDSKTDIDIAQALSARPVLVRTGRGRLTEAHYADDAMVDVVDDLAVAVDMLLD